MLKKWRNWRSISLLLANKRWKAELIWEEDRRVFGNGWQNFAEECELEVGDKLVLFRSLVTGPKTINVVIFKRQDKIANSSRHKQNLNTNKKYT